MNKQDILNSIKGLIETYAGESLAQRFDPANPRVLLHEPTFGSQEIWEALESLLSTQVTMGAKVKRFEKEFAEHFEFSNASMVNSGSSANLLAVSALSNPARDSRLQPGDEVIVPALSWSTTIWPLIQHGLVPVIVDIDPVTLNVDPEQIERAVSEKTKAIMLVHVYGNPCKMDEVMGIVNRRSVLLIEDCCEALGATFDGKPVGSFGVVGTFSFYFSHHITTLEGGMCVTDDGDLAELMRVLRAHGWVRETANPEAYAKEFPEIHPRFLFVNSGYNLRATELQGGFGYVQLPKLNAFVETRTDNAGYWRRELGELDEFFDYQLETLGGKHSWFGFPMAVKEQAPFKVGDLCDFLNARGIETRPIVAGNIATQPAMRYYEHRVVGDLEHTNNVMRNGFTFGNHQDVDEPAREYITGVIKEFAAERGLI